MTELKQLIKNLHQAKDEQERVSKLTLIKGIDLKEFVNNSKAMTILKIWLTDEKKKSTGLLSPLIELILTFPFDLESLKSSGLGKYVKAFEKSDNSYVRQLVERIVLKWKNIMENAIKASNNNTSDSSSTGSATTTSIKDATNDDVNAQTPISLSSSSSSSSIAEKSAHIQHTLPNQKIPTIPESDLVFSLSDDCKIPKSIVHVHIPVLPNEIIHFEDKIIFKPPLDITPSTYPDKSLSPLKRKSDSLHDSFVKTKKLNKQQKDKSKVFGISFDIFSELNKPTTTLPSFKKSPSSSSTRSAQNKASAIDSIYGYMELNDGDNVNQAASNSSTTGSTNNNTLDSIFTSTITDATTTPSSLSLLEDYDDIPMTSFSYKQEKPISSSNSVNDSINLSEDREGGEESKRNEEFSFEKKDSLFANTPPSRFKKRVTFAPSYRLVQVRLFDNTPEERAYRNWNTKSPGNKDFERNEGRDAFSSSLEIEDDVSDLLIPWNPPQPLPLSFEYGTKSLEKDVQKAREKLTLAAVYYSEQHIPPSPYEPTESAPDGSYKTTIIPLQDVTLPNHSSSFQIQPPTLLSQELNSNIYNHTNPVQTATATPFMMSTNQQPILNTLSLLSQTINLNQLSNLLSSSSSSSRSPNKKPF